MYSIILPLAPSFHLICTSLLIGIISTCATLAQEQVLDTTYPIIIEENVTTSSSFGYTVSLAKGTREISNQPTGWIFIGAPKSNVSNAIRYGGTSGDEDTEAGVVWRCSLGHDNNNDNCKMINIDPRPGKSKKRPNNSPALENHARAFIGGSMEIKYDRFVTCGLGWKRGNNTFFNGICYWFKSKSNQKGRSDFDREDLTNLVDMTKYEHRLMPFFQSSTNDKYFHYYDGPGNLTNAREWQTSQAGISVNLFLDGNGQSDSSLLIGAPGVREWSGAVVVYRNSKTPKPEMQRINRNAEDATFSEFLVLNRGEIPREGDKNVKYRWNEYFGYSVSSGKYFSEGKVLYAVGAPRAGRKGSVTIFDEPPYSKINNETYKRQVKPIQEIWVPSVPEKNSFWSYFGSVLYTVDLDGNKLDELVIGAPMYSFLEQNSSGDHGAVFVYSKSKNETNTMALSQVLSGSKISKARFGSAISSIVFELKNKTKQVYLVVGAPFEYSIDIAEGSTGAIYLYKSWTNGTLETEYTQRIVASQFGHTIKAFGTSISNAEDIDYNKTPDLAIGAFESSHAVILRTRPQIFIHSSLKFDDIINGEIKRGSTSFILKSCFTIDEVFGLLQNRTEIWVKISYADNRLKFSDKKSDNLGITFKSRNELIYKNSAVNTHSRETCTNFEMLATNQRNGFGYGNSADSTAQDDYELLPITFYQEVWFNGTKYKNLTLSKLSTSRGRISYNFSEFSPRLPTAQHTKSEGRINISLSECSDRVCHPNIKMEWTFFYPDADDDIKPNYTLSEHMLGQSRKEIVMQLSMLNRNETVLLKSVAIEWNMKNVNEVSGINRWIEGNCQDIFDSQKSQYLCPFEQYIRKDRNATIIQIYLDMDQVYVNSLKNLRFTVSARLNFKDDRISSISSTGGLTFRVPKTMALISGSKNSNEVLRRAANYNVSDSLTSTNPRKLYAPFQQRFTIEVQGASVNEVLAEFKIPVVPNNVVDSSPYFLVNFPQYSSSFGNNNTFEKIECGDTPNSRSPYKLVRIGNTDSMVVHQRKRREISEENETVALPNNFNTNDSQQVTTDQPSIIAEDPEPPTFHKVPALQYPEDSLKFDCNSSETGCIEVTCKITNVRAKRHFHVVFYIYPVQNEVDKLLKESGKNTIFLESTGIVAIFPRDTTTSGGDIMHSTDKNFAQTILKSIDTTPVQLWIYIAAGCGGLLFLALIVVGLYYCGFFKREKRQELNKLRADHHRKSMAAAAAMRASMMVQSSGISGLSSGGPTSGAESRENLTEAEFHNEDMDEKDDDNVDIVKKGKNSRTEVDNKEDKESVKTTQVDL